MGWFTGKQDSTPMRDDQGTTSDKEWHDLQARAAKANPQRARFGTEESAEAARRGAEQYRNRTNS